MLVLLVYQAHHQVLVVAVAWEGNTVGYYI
jgi:hypothetical protein